MNYCLNNGLRMAPRKSERAVRAEAFTLKSLHESAINLLPRRLKIRRKKPVAARPVFSPKLLLEREVECNRKDPNAARRRPHARVQPSAVPQQQSSFARQLLAHTSGNFDQFEFLLLREQRKLCG